uniref:Uncharacterized protein n=1 Tax=Chromera velia CCMP2878 TaxID=1169474 RepID=A0A0G4HIG6_9ALVE|eukprot:Cvel_27781.t1-p1 / transcript=Cvel_27781.t1 / gene=Cvel_27781 / organism=Chromera_velia_CCMP2878 / gene_product=hypothetical protein / transcript_product=hypothetical protein / location=Cvel_scaffold3524:9020-10755(-) / protein_length=95 / sequence_SO=supercontig / SO=protein_coding / is_pseudo=false
MLIDTVQDGPQRRLVRFCTPAAVVHPASLLRLGIGAHTDVDTEVWTCNSLPLGCFLGRNQRADRSLMDWHKEDQNAGVGENRSSDIHMHLARVPF